MSGLQLKFFYESLLFPDFSFVRKNYSLFLFFCWREILFILKYIRIYRKVAEGEFLYLPPPASLNVIILHGTMGQHGTQEMNMIH